MEKKVNELIMFRYCACVYFMLLAGVAGSNPSSLEMKASCVFCFVLGRVFCDHQPSPRQESYRVWCF